MIFSNVNDLRSSTIVPQPNEICDLLGYYAPSDMGGGEFYWDAASTATDNGGTIFKINTVATGRWKRIYDAALNIRWFGAKGDGVAADDTAFNNCILTAGNGSEIVLGGGNYRLTTGLSFTGYSNIRFVGNRCFITADFSGGTLFSFSLNQPSQVRAEGIEFVEIKFQGQGATAGTTCLGFNGYAVADAPTTAADFAYYAFIRIIQCNIDSFDTAVKFNVCRNVLVDNCNLSGNKNGIYFLNKHAESTVRDTVIYCAGSTNEDSYGIRSESTYSGDYNTNEGLVIEGSTIDFAQYGIHASNAQFWKITGNYIGTQLIYTDPKYAAGYRAYTIFLERTSLLAIPPNTTVFNIANNDIYRGAIKISNGATGTWTMQAEISDNVFSAMNDNAIQLEGSMAHINITGVYADKFSPAESIPGAAIEIGGNKTVMNISKITTSQKFVNAVNITGSNVTYVNIEGILHAGTGAIISNPANNNISVLNLRGNGLPFQKLSSNIPVGTYSSGSPMSVSTSAIPVVSGMKGRITLVGAFNPSVAGQVLLISTAGVGVTIPSAPGSSAQFHKLYGTGMRMICHIIPFTATATGNLSAGLSVLDYLGGTTLVDYHSFITIEVDAY